MASALLVKLNCSIKQENKRHETPRALRYTRQNDVFIYIWGEKVPIPHTFEAVCSAQRAEKTTADKLIQFRIIVTAYFTKDSRRQ
jgi:uridylate kinase